MSDERIIEEIHIVQKEIARYKKVYESERDDFKSMFTKNMIESLENQLRLLREQKENHE